MRLRKKISYLCPLVGISPLSTILFPAPTPRLARFWFSFSSSQTSSISSLVTDAGWKVQEKRNPETLADSVLGTTAWG